MTSTTAGQPQPATTGSLLGKVKLVLTISAFAGLLSTNIATLTSEAAHTTLFDGLKQVIEYALAEAVANRLLSHSPTEVRKTDVAKQTVALEAEKQALRNTANVLEGEKQTLKKERDVLDQHNKTLSAEHEDLKTKHQKLSADHQGLNERHNRLAADHNELTTKHSALTQTTKLRQEKVRQMSARIAPRVGGIAAKSLSTLPVRAAPYVGTAASVAFTAWELSELCFLMNDLEELNLYFGTAYIDHDKVCGLPKPNLSDFHF